MVSPRGIACIPDTTRRRTCSTYARIASRLLASSCEVLCLCSQLRCNVLFSRLTAFAWQGEPAFDTITYFTFSIDLDNHEF